MSGVLKKAVADLRGRKLQAVVVATVVLLSSLAGTLAVSLLVESDAPFDHAFNQADGAHLVVTYDTSRTSSAQILATTRVPAVAAAAGPFPETRRLEVAPGFGPHVGLRFLGRADPGGPVDRLTLVAGRWVHRDGEVVVARRIQKPLGAQVGDMLPVLPGQGIEALRVVGIAAAVNDATDAWLMPGQAAAIQGAPSSGDKPSGPPATAMVFYRLLTPSTPADIAAASQQVTAAVPPGAVLDATNWLDAKRSADTTTAVMIPFLLAFSLFALVAAAMIIGNVVSGAVIAGYREIGIMKAVGFTPLQVVATLAIQMMVPAIAGAGIGTGGGALAAQPFLDQTAAAFDLPAEPGLVPPVLAGCLVAALAVVLVATVVPASRAARLSAAEAISSGSAPQGDGGRRAARVFGRLPLPRALTLGITDALARPVRSSMTLVAVAIGVATITFAVGLTRSLDLVKHSLTHDQTVQATLYRGGPGRPGDASAALSDAQAVALIEGQPATARYVGEGFLAVHVDGVGQPVRFFGYRGDARWIGFEMLAGRWYAGPGEAVVPQALLTAAGRHLGDSLTVGFDGRQETLKVVGVIFDTNGDNVLIRTDWSSFAALAPAATPASYDIQVVGGTSPRQYSSALLAASGDPRLDIRLADEGDAGTTFLLIESVLGGLAVVLTLIAMAGVFNTVVLNTRERARDIAILRALGMAPFQVVAMVLVSVTVVGLVGAAVGIPSGQVLQRQVLTVMGQIASATEVPGRFYAVYPITLLLLLAVVGVGVGTLAAWLPATWAARVRVSPVLASE